jgi:DNA/RNA endonuclease YhcR with UshA esterase domain
MKKLLALLIGVFASAVAFSQTVPLDSVAKYEGKKITVCSKVTGTHVSSGDKKNINLNFGKPFPDNVFSVFIAESDASGFKNNPADFLKDKNVCVTGVVKIYKGKPEIVVTKEDQIKIQ